jgi:hypothetical protein
VPQHERQARTDAGYDRVGRREFGRHEIDIAELRRSARTDRSAQGLGDAPGPPTQAECLQSSLDPSAQHLDE